MSLDFGLVYSQIFQKQQDIAPCSLWKQMRPVTHLHKLLKYGSVNCYSRRKAVSPTPTSVYFSFFWESLYIDEHTHTLLEYSVCFPNLLNYSFIYIWKFIYWEIHTYTHTGFFTMENCVCFPNLFNHSFMKSVRPLLGWGDSAMASKIPMTRVEWGLNSESQNGKSN